MLQAMTRRAASLNAGFKVLSETQGPTVVTAIIEPDVDVRVASIRRIEEDLAVAAGAAGVRVAASAGGLQLQYPRRERQMLHLEDYRDAASPGTGDVLMGVDVLGEPVVMNLRDLPHLAVCGATGGGKSVFLHMMICWLLAKHSSADLRLLLVDPKGDELDIYRGLPHVAGMCSDAGESVDLLEALVEEMDARYRGRTKDPSIVLVIDEWADLFDQAPTAKTPLKRLLQKARAACIHVVLATQRPSVKVIGGDLKANLPTRLCLRAATGVDSKVVLDETGAEKLLGRGDGLLKTAGGIARIQVPYAGPEFVKKLHRHYS